jgi:hypothetical protein
MPGKNLLAAVLVLGVGAIAAFAQSPSEIDISRWKTYRNETMGFETKYPATWHVRSVTGTGPETVMIDETPQVGKPHLAVQFWVQRQINPQGLSIEPWYADQLRKSKAAPLPTSNVSIGGRPTVRMEAVGSSGRTFYFFTALNKTDIFEIIVTQPSSQTPLDPIYQKLASTIRFIE